MPKLLMDKANEVREAAANEGLSGKYAFLPEGRYRFKLMDVQDGQSKKGDRMWTWEFRVVSYVSGDGIPRWEDKVVDISEREFRYYTVIKDNTLWDLARIFDAFKADPGTDTAELIGEEVIVDIRHVVQDRSRRKDKLSEEIGDFYTLEDGVPKAETYEKIDPANGKASDEPPF